MGTRTQWSRLLYRICTWNLDSSHSVASVLLRTYSPASYKQKLKSCKRKKDIACEYVLPTVIQPSKEITLVRALGLMSSQNRHINFLFTCALRKRKVGILMFIYISRGKLREASMKVVSDSWEVVRRPTNNAEACTCESMKLDNSPQTTILITTNRPLFLSFLFLSFFSKSAIVKNAYNTYIQTHLNGSDLGLYRSS